MQDICAMLFKTCEGEAMEKSSILEWHKQIKVCWNVEITYEDNMQHFILYEWYYSLQFIPQGQIVN
jgi:hypothetical protein